MATVPHTRAPSPEIRAHRIHWDGFAASGDVGEAVAWNGWNDCTMQALGTFAGSISITMQGSLDGGTTWFALTDLNATTIALTAAGGKGISEVVPLIRPAATAGSGGADVDVWLYVTGYQP